MLAPFPYFGGKRSVGRDVWRRFGHVRHYIEPFCGSAAILLAAPSPASLEVVSDGSGFIANFWRAVKYQPAKVAEWADYPVSHIDLGARHRWLMSQRDQLNDAMQDPEWPGDAKVAGWWLWGQCIWIAGGWCNWGRLRTNDLDSIPQLTPLNQGILTQRSKFKPYRTLDSIPSLGEAGRGIQAIGQIPSLGNRRQGIQSISKTRMTSENSSKMMTSSGRVGWQWLHELAERMERVRVLHGDWSRCLNNTYGGDATAVFLDPPYRAYEKFYGVDKPVADEVEEWARQNANLKIALCGHRGDYQLPGWTIVDWSRRHASYGRTKTVDEECIWYSPSCILPDVNTNLLDFGDSLEDEDSDL